MPFDAPYRDTFEKGDLIYGLANYRSTWIMKHGAQLGKNWIDRFTITMKENDKLDAVNADFIIKTLDHPKYHSVMSTKDHPRTTESQQHEWRTKSKAGLNWAVTTGKHVHFILDGLNMKEVAEKSNTIGNPDSPQGKAGPLVAQTDKIRTITNAELRWVYRHQNNAETKKFIQFWLDDKPCCPPWYPAWDSGKGKKVAGDKAWEGYTPTTMVD